MGRAGAGGCGGGAPRPHGPMTPAGPTPARSARSRPPPAAQREPVPGEVVGRDSSRGQPSPKFDAGRAGCKVAAATDSDGWVASRLRAARACHLGTSVRACALGWRRSPREVSGWPQQPRHRSREARSESAGPHARRLCATARPSPRCAHCAAPSTRLTGSGKGWQAVRRVAAEHHQSVSGRPSCAATLAPAHRGGSMHRDGRSGRPARRGDGLFLPAADRACWRSPLA